MMQTTKINKLIVQRVGKYLIFEYQLFYSVVKCFRWYFDNFLKNIFLTFNSSWSLSIIRSFCGNIVRASVNEFLDIIL